MTRPWLMLPVVACLMNSALAQPASSGPFKIVVWYRLDDPAATRKHQVYDVARGQFDARGVDAWLALIGRSYPDHAAYVRDLSVEPGDPSTLPRRIAQAIEAENRRFDALLARPSPRLRGFEPPSGPPPTQPIPLPAFRPAPGLSPGATSSPASPFPYPYRAGPR
jgi:hypothetical protein